MGLKGFNENIINCELSTSLSLEIVHDYISFEKSFTAILNKHVPLKKKELRAKHASYVTKPLSHQLGKVLSRTSTSYQIKLYLKKNMEKKSL